MSERPVRSSRPKKPSIAGRRMLASTRTTCDPVRASATAMLAAVRDVPSESAADTNMTALARLARMTVPRFSLAMRYASADGPCAPPRGASSTSGCSRSERGGVGDRREQRHAQAPADLVGRADALVEQVLEERQDDAEHEAQDEADDRVSGRLRLGLVRVRGGLDLGRRRRPVRSAFQQRRLPALAKLSVLSLRQRGRRRDRSPVELRLQLLRRCSRTWSPSAGCSGRRRSSRMSRPTLWRDARRRPDRTPSR